MPVTISEIQTALKTSNEELLEHVEKRVSEKNDELKLSLQEETKLAIADLMGSVEEKINHSIEVVKDHDAEKKTRFKSFGEQLIAIHRASLNAGSIDPRLKAATGLGEGIASDGGFLVQSDFAQTLIERTHEVSILADRVEKIQVDGNGLILNAIDETSRANGSRYGGVQAFWTDEAGTMSGSKPKMRQMELKLKKLTALMYATDELLEDASAITDVANRAFSKEIAFKVDDAIYNGDGAGKPAGIINSPALVTIAKESGQKAATVEYKNVAKMWSRLYAPNRKNAIWLINQDVETELWSMNIPIGTGGVPVFLPPGGLSQSPYSQLFGRPVIPVEQAATLGTSGDIMLVDLNEYLLIDKGQMKSDMSIHVRFINDEVTFRFIYRVDGQTTWHSPLTPFKGNATRSPYVVLATRA